MSSGRSPPIQHCKLDDLLGSTFVGGEETGGHDRTHVNFNFLSDETAQEGPDGNS